MEEGDTGLVNWSDRKSSDGLPVLLSGEMTLEAESPGRVLDTLLEVWVSLEVLDILCFSLFLLRWIVLILLLRLLRLWAMSGLHRHMNPLSSLMSLY